MVVVVESGAAGSNEHSTHTHTHTHGALRQGTGNVRPYCMLSWELVRGWREVLVLPI